MYFIGHVMQTIFQAPNKLLKLNQNKISLFLSFFIFFGPFVCCLSVVLLLDKGDFPEDLHTVCPC